MATINRWTSPSTGVWDTAGNWSLGHIPLTTEIPTFDGGSQVAVTSGPAAPILFDNVVVTPDYGGNWGSSGAAITNVGVNSTTVITSRFIHRGSGTLWLKDAQGFFDLVVDGRGTVQLDTNSGVGGSIRNVFVKAGTVVAASTCEFAASLVKLDGPSAIMTINEKATTEQSPSIIHVEAGLMTCHRSSPGTVIVNGGEVILDGLLVGTDIHLIVGSNGRLRYEPVSDPAPGAGSEPNVYYDGLLDLSRSKFSIKFNRRVQGVLGNLVGTPGDIEDFAPLGVEIDLSKDYP